MNPETGKFEPLKATDEKDGVGNFFRQLLRLDGSPVPRHWAIFSVDELVTVKDTTFKVAYINESTLILEPVPIDTPLVPPEEHK